MCWRRYKARSQAGPYGLFQGLGWMGLESVGSVVQLVRLKVGFCAPKLLVFYIFFIWIWKLHTPPNQPPPRTPWQAEEHTEEMYWGVLRAISTPPKFQLLITFHPVVTDKKSVNKSLTVSTPGPSRVPPGPPQSTEAPQTIHSCFQYNAHTFSLTFLHDLDRVHFNSFFISFFSLKKSRMKANFKVKIQNTNTKCNKNYKYIYKQHFVFLFVPIHIW